MTKIHPVLPEIGPKTTFNLGLKKHKTLPHNLGKEKTLKCDDCAYTL